MRIHDKIFEFTWHNVESGDFYELLIYSSHSSTINSLAERIKMNADAILDIEVGWERDGLPIGLSSACSLKVEFDLYKLSEDFVDTIEEPFYPQTLAYTGSGDLTGFNPVITFESGNVFFLRIWKNEYNIKELFFTQKAGLDGIFENDTLKIECFSLSRVASEAIEVSVLENLKNINSSHFLQRQSAWDIFYVDSGIKYLWFTDSQHSSVYFQFLKLEIILNAIKILIREVSKKIIRNYYISGLDSDDFYNVTHYKQDYTIGNLLGNELDVSELYIIAFITNSATMHPDRVIKSFVNVIDNYKSIWDFLKVIYMQTMVRARSLDVFKVQKIMGGSVVQVEPINKAKIEKYGTVLQRCESSLNDFDDDDIKAVTVMTGSSSTDNSLTIPIIFNNIPPDRKNTIDINLTGEQGRSRADFSLQFFRSYGKPLLTNLYYYEESNAIDYVFVRVHSKFKFDLNATRDSLEIYDLDISYDTAPRPKSFTAKIQQYFTCKTRILPYICLVLFGNKKQTKISGVQIKNTYDNITAFLLNDNIFEVDLSAFAPPHLPNLFTDLSNKFYITKVLCKLKGGSRTNNYIELDGINQQKDLES